MSEFIHRSNGCIVLVQTRDVCEGIHIRSCFLNWLFRMPSGQSRTIFRAAARRRFQAQTCSRLGCPRLDANIPAVWTVHATQAIAHTTGSMFHAPESRV